MGFGEAIQSGFSHYVTFSGRAQRSAYWFWILFFYIAIFITAFIDAVIFGSPSVLYLICLLGLFLPTLAISIRRLHDLDRSGWWVLISLVPLIGFILLLVWYCTKGTTGPNRFGTDPLGG